MEGPRTEYKEYYFIAAVQPHFSRNIACVAGQEVIYIFKLAPPSTKAASSFLALPTAAVALKRRWLHSKARKSLLPVQSVMLRLFELRSL